MSVTISLRELTTLRVGGRPARYFRPHSEDELARCLAECAHIGLPHRIIGGGSNLLVEDGTLPHAVIHIASPWLDCIERTGPSTVVAGAGTPTARLAIHCAREGLAGLEFLAGLPGTVGGAVAGNAGAWGHSIGERIQRLWGMDCVGRPLSLSRDDMRFSYRSSNLDGVVITRVEFSLEPASPQQVAARMREHMRTRAERHPIGQASAGCIFKNPPGQSAGKLIEACGLKGCSIGDAEVSRQHANFIINRGRATAQDVLDLVELARKAVLSRFGIELELEVRHWPARACAA